MKPFKNISKSKLIKISIAGILFIASLAIALITALQGGQPFISKAWSKTYIKVEAVCPGDGFASINITVTNEQGKPMTVIATDTQTGGIVDLGRIEHTQTITGTINTSRQQLSPGEVKVKLQWADGNSSDSDTKTVKYSAVGCEGATPTPTSTLTPTVEITSTNTPTPSPTPRLGTCGYTPCNETTNPCASGLTCVQADNGKFYCAKPEFETACKNNPSGGSCCFAPVSTSTPTPIPSATRTPTPTVTPTGTLTPGPTATNTPTPSRTPTPTVTPTGTLTPGPTATNTPTPSRTPTPTVTPTGTLTPQPTSTGNPTATPTEIIVAKVSSTPTTNPPTTEPTIPSAGLPIPWIVLAVPVLFMMVGLLF